MTMTSITEWIRTLYDYSAWANNRVLDTAGQLTDAQFLQGGGASFDSLRDTLVHTLSAQWIWLSRWQGYSPGAMLIPEEFTDLQFVRDHWRVVETDTRKFVAALDSEQLNAEVAYTNTRGLPFSYPLWQLMVHQVNHATQHRSEAAVMLTHLDHSPGSLDLLTYLGEVSIHNT